jgi:hypothetical protein
LLGKLNVDGSAAFAVEFEHDVAHVEGEVIAVEPLTAEFLVGIGQRREKMVEVVAVIKDDGADSPDLRHRLFEWRAQATQQVGDGTGRCVDVRDSIGDVVAP